MNDYCPSFRELAAFKRPREAPSANLDFGLLTVQKLPIQEHRRLNLAKGQCLLAACQQSSNAESCYTWILNEKAENWEAERYQISRTGSDLSRIVSILYNAKHEGLPCSSCYLIMQLFDWHAWLLPAEKWKLALVKNCHTKIHAAIGEMHFDCLWLNAHNPTTDVMLCKRHLIQHRSFCGQGAHFVSREILRMSTEWIRNNLWRCESRKVANNALYGLLILAHPKSLLSPLAFSSWVYPKASL